MSEEDSRPLSYKVEGMLQRLFSVQAEWASTGGVGDSADEIVFDAVFE